MATNDVKRIVTGALLLTIAGITSKILSATYRIPLQNLTGDLGFYIYQQIYPLIGTVMILSLYGFPVAISKLLAEREQNSNPVTYRNFYIPLLIVLFSMNCIFFLILIFSAPKLSAWINDEQLTQAYQIGAFLFLLIPFLALLRGVFLGNNKLKQVAYSQVMEQIIRVTVIVIVASLIYVGKMNVYRIGEAGVIATALGMLVAMITLMFSFFSNKNKKDTFINTKVPWRYYFYTCISFGLVASLNHLILIIIQFADVFTLVPHLIEYGLSPIQAMETKGVFDRGIPFIQFGVIVGSAFALVLVPTVTNNHNNQWSKSVQEALIISFYISSGATMGLLLIFPEVNELLFTNRDGTIALQMLVISILLTSISITGSAILQSLGRIKEIGMSIIIAFVVKWVLNQSLIPILGIYGSSLATVMSLFLLAVFVLISLHKNIPSLYFLRSIHWSAFLFASVGMGIYIIIIKFMIVHFITLSRLGLLLYVLFIVLTGGLIYISLLIRNNAFSEQQIKALPFSKAVFTLRRIVAKK